MKANRIALVVALVLVAAPAPAQGPSPAQQAFEKLKTLVGEWEGTNSAGYPVTASYHLASNGSVLVETLREQEGQATLTMLTTYYVDNGRLLMTHYCGAANQPRMQAAGLSLDGPRIRFTFVDVTNMPDVNTGHMRGLQVNFVDAAHYTQQWTWRENGKDTVNQPFRMTRQK